jgi:CRISPR-associated endonuclease/helicase Cas3
MPESYSDFFHRITSNRPFPYQERFALNPFSPTLLIVPTGLGKTDAVVVPWLYARHSGLAAPTRLALVLPRQNLTAQTARRVRTHLEKAGLQAEIDVLELMAGSADNRENIAPGRPCIIVATQDLFFSRALNRGYARRPPRWPIDFALYNQDCLIVLDEIQLMDDALATSTQLAAFREQFGTYGSAPCIWMSATVNPDWLRTVDFRQLPPILSLDGDDLKDPTVHERLHAVKSIAPAPASCRTPAGCAEFALAQHKPATRTLVIVNTVPRAREIAAAIRTHFPGVILLHSRFRPADRRALENLFETIPPEGQIIVSTQVLEAGIDVSATRLITDLAPWGSLVQRFGRVNRYGKEPGSEIWWVDLPAYSKQKDPALPYTQPELDRAAARLRTLSSAAPNDLPQEDGPAPWRNVLRRCDLLDLFDTSPDLSGNDLDVSRFIRATDEKDAYLAWREWDGEGPPPAGPELHDAELCPVPIGDIREFARKHHVFAWSFALEKWVSIGRDDPLYPGMVLVTRMAEGGYTELDGWLPESKAPVKPYIPAPKTPAMEGDSSDSLSCQTYRQLLRDHTDGVMQELEAILSALPLSPEIAAALRVAAAKHDWGKAHEVFQRTMYRGSEPSNELLAKREGHAVHERPNFRHELASAVAILTTGESDLAAYLAAAHHGRVRMSIRSMPGESDEGVARGIRDGETLPACELATGLAVPAVTLSLRPMHFGADGGSWTERMIRLRDSLGPFRLAYLEMLLRAADAQASANPHLEDTACTK